MAIAVEREVNARIRENTQVATRLMAPEEAVDAGALALYSVKSMAKKCAWFPWEAIRKRGHFRRNFVVGRTLRERAILVSSR